MLWLRGKAERDLIFLPVVVADVAAGLRAAHRAVERERGRVVRVAAAGEAVDPLLAAKLPRKAERRASGAAAPAGRKDIKRIDVDGAACSDGKVPDRLLPGYDQPDRVLRASDTGKIPPQMTVKIVAVNAIVGIDPAVGFRPDDLSQAADRPRVGL